MQQTKELVVAKITPELTRLNYQKLLQEAENIVITKETIGHDYSSLKTLKKVAASINEVFKEEAAPLREQLKAITDAQKSVVGPIEDVLERKLKDVSRINEQIKQENAQIAEANRKSAEVTQFAREFINNAIRDISNAKTPADVSKVEMAIGSQKSRSGYYGNQFETFKTACDNLSESIKARKEIIRKEAKLQEETKSALAKGDIQKATDLKEEIELLDYEAKENVIRIQQKAFEESTVLENVVTETTVEEVSGRNYWRWEVTNLKLLAKKMPELVETVPNKAAIDVLLATKRKDGSLKGKTEEDYFGIRFFILQHH